MGGVVPWSELGLRDLLFIELDKEVAVVPGVIITAEVVPCCAAGALRHAEMYV